MSLFLNGKLRRLARTAEGRQLLDAAYPYAVKHAQDTKAREILKQAGVSADAMPSPRDPLTAATDAARLEELKEQTGATNARGIAFHGMYPPADDGLTDEIEDLEMRDELDWAITHTVNEGELSELGRDVRKMFANSELAKEMFFADFVQLVEQNLNHLGPNMKAGPKEPTIGIGF